MNIKIKKLIRYIDEKFLNKNIYLTTIKLTNRFSHKSILSSDGLPVSLTSYGKRINSVFYTIESIARGSILPSRLILWLDEKERYDNLPVTLIRLKKRGLVVRFTENYGPHTKYFPYVLAYHSDNLPLVTADDDILYPIFWLKGFRDAYAKNPNLIYCYRAWVVKLNHELNKIEPYKTWSSCSTLNPSFSNFGTGVSGVVYPPAFLTHLYKASDGFKLVCPKADDIWLHVNALRAGYKVQRLSQYPLHLQTIPSTQDESLYHTNVTKGHNDQQIAKTYQASDIAILRAEKLVENNSSINS